MGVSLPSHGETSGGVSLFPWDGSVLAEFATWLRSLHGPTASMVLHRDTVHLKGVGAMADGTPVRLVIVLPHGAEYDLLAANTEIAENVPVALELLLSLVDSESAESRVPVTAGTAVAS